MNKAQRVNKVITGLHPGGEPLTIKLGMSHGGRSELCLSGFSKKQMSRWALNAKTLIEETRMGENRGWQSAGRLLGLQRESETAWTGRVKVSKAAGGSEEGPCK